MDIFRWLTQQWDRTTAAILAVVGLASLYLGWNGLSHVKLPSQQIPYLASGGLLGLFALGASATLWLSADLRDEWRELHKIETKLSELCEILRQTGSSDSVDEQRSIVAGTNGTTNSPPDGRPPRPMRADQERSDGRPASVDRAEDMRADV